MLFGENGERIIMLPGLAIGLFISGAMSHPSLVTTTHESADTRVATSFHRPLSARIACGTRGRSSDGGTGCAVPLTEVHR